MTFRVLLAVGALVFLLWCSLRLAPGAGPAALVRAQAVTDPPAPAHLVPTATPIPGSEPLPLGATIETVSSDNSGPIAMVFDPADRLFYTDLHG
ncbi:MAG TPA: hypothetical protein VKY74_20875, partial [Chloroflexia bacterium]|nr:hypothetical protein [Chloroflexia bacterium]